MFIVKPHPINIDLPSCHIGGWYIDPSLCDKIIEDFELNTSSHINLEHTPRGYTVISDISHYMSPPIVQDLFGAIDEVHNSYKELYPACSNSVSSYSLCKDMNVQRYRPGKHYSDVHCENTGDANYTSRRHLVFMLYLNDVTEGGETDFILQKIRIQPQKGLFLFWPAYWTHIHRGLPSNTMTKYIVTGWFEHNTYNITPVT